MNKRAILSEQISFYNLIAIKKYSIEIPIIQRDFAQGRKSQEQVRNLFLDTLYNYLEDGKPFRDLDFIYGDVDEYNNLILLDGQQRLTTLFLLHWYLSLKENQYESFQREMYLNDNIMFCYKIRTSSTDFCKALLEHGTSINLQNIIHLDEDTKDIISEKIKDQFWFFMSWQRDPTVQAMLCMIDAIHCKFKNSNRFYEKLIDQEKPVITFRFLPLKDYGLSDDLYIKMNSRGKPLSRFENFKAKFEQFIGESKFKSKKYSLPLGRTADAKTYFSLKIDTQWTELFWHLKIQKEEKMNGDVLDFEIDGLIMNFISTLAINHVALSKKEVRCLIEIQEELPLSFYTNLGDEFIPILIGVLDILCSDVNLKTFINDKKYHYYNEQEMFDKIINKSFSDAGYSERIIFFAYYIYIFVKKHPYEGLSDWMRVIVNLTQNTSPYNDDTEFLNSIRMISNLVLQIQSNNVLEYLKSNQSENLKSFNTIQIQEECIKAHLITKNEEWKDIILEAEKHKYFKGQISFALAFSGIEDHYNLHHNCDMITDVHKNMFNDYIEKTFALFDDNGLKKEANENHRLHRAILRKGNYLIYSKSNLSFLNDKDRDVSWKRFLQGDGERYNKREFFKMVLDDPKFIKDSLDSLDSVSFDNEPLIDSWRLKFISCPQLFENMENYKFIRILDNGLIYLLKGSKLSGEHSELNTMCFYYDLQKDIKQIKPFETITPYKPSGDNDEPCVVLTDWKGNNCDFCILIYCIEPLKYKARFAAENNKISGNITSILKDFGFIETDESYFEVVFGENELKQKIIALCEALRNNS